MNQRTTTKHAIAIFLLVQLMACVGGDINKSIPPEAQGLTGVQQPEKIPRLLEEHNVSNKKDEALNAVTTTPDNHSDSAVADGVDISHRYEYKVRGKHYKVFNNSDSFQEIGMASWYGPGFHGKKTANGERYNMYAMTAAHKTLPLGSRVQVTHLATGKKVIVRINDRGPFHQGRIIDLSKKAAQQLGILRKGSAKVHVKALK